MAELYAHFCQEIGKAMRTASEKPFPASYILEPSTKRLDTVQGRVRECWQKFIAG